MDVNNWLLNTNTYQKNCSLIYYSKKNGRPDIVHIWRPVIMYKKQFLLIILASKLFELYRVM